MLLTAAFLLAASTAQCNASPSVVKLADPSIAKAYYERLAGSHVATVAVTLDAAGDVTDAHIYQSTGDTMLDAAAVEAAKRSTYAPGQSACKPLGGTFAVQFSFVGERPGPVSGGCPRPAYAIRIAAARLPRAIWIPLSKEVHVAVEVTIGPDGKLSDERIVQSSGSMAMDQAAMKAARDSTYEPRLVAIPDRRQAGSLQSNSSDGFVCRPATGRYLFKVTFARNPFY